jgi:hypothetical protein
MLPGFIGVIEGGAAQSVRALKPGSHVSFTVKGRNADGSWTLFLGGRELKVRAEAQLVPGSRMRAAVSLVKGRIYLKILHDTGTGKERESAGGNGMRTQKVQDGILEGMIKTGMPIREELVSSLSRLYCSLQTNEKTLYRLIALFADKELYPRPEEIERLVRQVGGREYAGGGEGKEEGKEERQKSGQRESGDRRGREAAKRRNVKSADITSAKMRKAAEGRISDRIGTAESSTGLLPLFNHIRGRHEHWIVVPFSLEEREDRIVLRCRIDAKGRIDRYTLSIFGQKSWHFSIKGYGKRKNCIVYSNDRDVLAHSGKYLEGLRKKLHNLPLDFDDTIREASLFEAFVSTHSGKTKGFDARV